MNRLKRYGFLTVASTVALLFTTAATANVRTVVTIDDHFDDGNILTNTNGVGTGFTRYSQGVTVTESGTQVTVPASGANRSSIESSESLDATGDDPAIFAFTGVQFAIAQNTTNNYNGNTRIGIRQNSPAGYTYSDSTLGHGFYVQCEDDEAGGWSGTSRFYYINESNVATNLVKWQFDTLDLVNIEHDGTSNNVSPLLDIKITLTANTWTLNITGDTQGVGSPISFSGTNTFGGDNNHGVTNGHAYIYNQTYAPAVWVYCDRVLVTTELPPLATVLMIQ